MIEWNGWIGVEIVEHFADPACLLCAIHGGTISTTSRHDARREHGSYGPQHIRATTDQIGDGGYLHSGTSLRHRFAKKDA